MKHIKSALAVVAVILAALLAWGTAVVVGPQSPTLSVLGLPTTLHGHVSVGIHASSPVLVTHSDNVDTSCNGICTVQVMDVSVDRPGPASITVIAVDGQRVSKPFEWRGVAR